MPRVRRRKESVATKLGDRIRQLRTENKWSQERLAAEAELDRSYVAGSELGARNPSLKALERLATAFGIPFRELFT